VLTVSFTIHLERPIAEGLLRATGLVVFEAKRIFVAESRLCDADGRELARGTGNFMRSRIPLGPDLGYL
nr:thioesterase [Deltaproteobacteria bacterium]